MSEAGASLVVVGDRVVVFLDYQNVYYGAREAFHPLYAPPWDGHVNPLKLAELITAKSPFDRELDQVRVYRGRPDSEKDPKGYGANLRQSTVWERLPKTKVFTRILRYPPDWPKSRAEEKGIDVALAVDFVAMAMRGEYDIGVIMSTDTDLKPALEAVLAMNGNPFPRGELAAWSVPEGYSRRLSIPGKRIWCHWLGESDYRSVADPTDYAKP